MYGGYFSSSASSAIDGYYVGHAYLGTSQYTGNELQAITGGTGGVDFVDIIGTGNILFRTTATLPEVDHLCLPYWSNVNGTSMWELGGGGCYSSVLQFFTKGTSVAKGRLLLKFPVPYNSNTSCGAIGSVTTVPVYMAQYQMFISPSKLYIYISGGLAQSLDPKLTSMQTILPKRYDAIGAYCGDTPDGYIAGLQRGDYYGQVLTPDNFHVVVEFNF